MMIIIVNNYCYYVLYIRFWGFSLEFNGPKPFTGLGLWVFLGRGG